MCALLFLTVRLDGSRTVAYQGYIFTCQVDNFSNHRTNNILVILNRLQTDSSWFEARSNESLSVKALIECSGMVVRTGPEAIGQDGGILWVRVVRGYDGTSVGAVGCLLACTMSRRGRVGLGNGDGAIAEG